MATKKTPRGRRVNPTAAVRNLRKAIAEEPSRALLERESTPILALLAGAAKLLPGLPKEPTPDAISQVEDILSLDYVQGFVDGFRGSAVEPQRRRRVRVLEGLEDGAMARRLLASLAASRTRPAGRGK